MKACLRNLPLDFDWQRKWLLLLVCYMHLGPAFFEHLEYVLDSSLGVEKIKMKIKISFKMDT